MKLRLKTLSSRLRGLTKEFFWILTGQIAAVLGALISVRILTDVMNPEEYGQLALGITIATMTGQAFLGPISSGVSRFFAPASEAGALRTYFAGINRLVFLIAITTLLLIAVVTIFSQVLNYQAWVPLFIPALLFSTVTGYNNIANGIQNAARQRAIVALHSGILPWLRILCAISLVLYFGVSSAIVIWGYVFATILVLISQYFFFIPILKNVNDQQYDINQGSHIWKNRIISYSWPFMTWGLFSAFHLISDRWSLVTFSSPSDVGLFSVLYQIGYYPVAIFAEMLVSLISPIIFHRAGDATSTQRLNNAIGLNIKVMLAVLIVTIFIFIFTWFTHAFIFKIFVAKNYSSISCFLPWFTLGAGMTAAGHVLSLARMSAMDTKGLIIPKILTAITGITLNIIGAYLHGLLGVIVAQLISSFIYFGCMIFQYLSFSSKQSHRSSFIL